MGGPDSVCSFRPRPAASRGISWGIRRRTAMCRRWLPEDGTSRSDGTSGTCFTCGEDIAKQGGIFGQYQGLLGSFRGRVIDTPISEEVVFGAALAGCRPVVEFHFVDFLFTGMGALVNQIMKIRYMAGGQGALPIILRGPDGRARSAAAHHSQRIETLFKHIPGIKVAIPSTPADVYGLYKTALTQFDPAIFFEHKLLYPLKGDVPDRETYIPLMPTRGWIVNEVRKFLHARAT